MTLLEAALDCLHRGWAVIPIGADKVATVKWSRFQKTPPRPRTVHQWFKNDMVQGVGIICGPVSGGLVVRDFDKVSAYEGWRQLHPELARSLPTVRTSRGYHVYFEANISRIVELDDGELRGAGYVLAPPSLHPDGPVYTWEIALPCGRLPQIEPVGADLCPELMLSEPAASESGRVQQSKQSKRKQTEQTDAIKQHRHSDDVRVNEAIEGTLPDGPGKRNRAVFNFARHLKALPHLADATAQQLRPLVKEWHRRALPVIRTKPFDETWIDFIFAWDRVAYPVDQSLVDLAAETAKSAEPPAEAAEYDTPEVRLLAAICRELQRSVGDDVFFLSCRTAQRLLGTKDHVKPSRWLRLLEYDGLLEVVIRGSLKGGRATRYRYTGKF